MCGVHRCIGLHMLVVCCKGKPTASWQMQARCLHYTVQDILTLMMSTAYTLTAISFHKKCMQEWRVYAWQAQSECNMH